LDVKKERRMDEKEKFEHSVEVIEDLLIIMKDINTFVNGSIKRKYEKKFDETIYSDRSDFDKEIILASLSGQFTNSKQAIKMFYDCLYECFKSYIKDYERSVEDENFRFSDPSTIPELDDDQEKWDSEIEAITLNITKKIKGKNNYDL